MGGKGSTTSTRSTTASTPGGISDAQFASMFGSIAAPTTAAASKQPATAAVYGEKGAPAGGAPRSSAAPADNPATTTTANKAAMALGRAVVETTIGAATGPIGAALAAANRAGDVKDAFDMYGEARSLQTAHQHPSVSGSLLGGDDDDEGDFGGGSGVDSGSGQGDFSGDLGGM